ncbi:MAG: polysaccharide biosynthesis C-terminal domain-containing protein, partial [Erysipelotrichaceae bacterium]|nr:polysaccharide biosynthesis C-terminal domain-containing protein [Erysipelotrichaceae bacterium]
VLLVRKLGTSIIMGLTAVIALFFVFFSGPLARQTLGVSAPLEDIRNLKTLFNILTIAIIIVPLLSSLRGYIQGLKRLDIYASSQVLEQFVRVFCILFCGYVFVIVLKFESITAIFVAIAAASVGAFIAYLFTKHLSKEDERHVEELAKQQDFDSGIVEKEIVKEILTIGIPYLIISFLGSAGPLVNTSFFLDYVTKVHGPEIYESAKLASGILQANIAKIANIPSVIAIGFGSGIVPYLSESLEKHDFSKISEQINQIIDTSNFILIPMVAVFVFFARDIYYIMYGNNNLDLGASLFAVSNIQILLGTIAPIFSSIAMSLKLRKEAVLTLIISFIIKFVTFFPLVKLFKAYGMIYSSGVYYLFQILMYFYFLRMRFDISITDSIKKMAMITISSLIMAIPALVIHNLIPFDYSSRLMAILIMILLGILMAAVYYFVTVGFRLPQEIFETEDVSLRSLLRRLRR